MRIITYFIVGLLVGNSILVLGLPEKHTQTQRLMLSFQDPYINDNGTTCSVCMTGAPACLYHPEQPVLPMFTTTLQLPFGSTIQEVTIQYDTENTLVLHEQITKAPSPYIQGVNIKIADTPYLNEETKTFDFYPPSWFSYSTGCGLNQDSDHVTFLTLQVYPARYNQTTDTLTYLSSCEIIITYEPRPNSPFPNQVINDLVIICPTQFVLPLLRLVDHKNMIGVRTRIITLAEIYRTYPGYDRPEQIKYCIKDVVEHWGTSYVLLVGGLKSHLVGKPRDNVNTGTRDWYVPVRYTNLWDDDVLFDPGFISDLYYADIYDSEGSFCTWNSFDDGVFGGWSHSNSRTAPDYPQDLVDFYPDVYLGRLPCRSIGEVRAIVKKIISYEKTPADPSWFNKIVVVAGDPYDDQGTNYLEGELIGEKAISYLLGFEPRRLFASNQYINPQFTPVSENIIREINQGCGFLFFDGHGGPSWWNTYWPGTFDSLIQNGGLSTSQFYQIRNGKKLPICIIGGCHNNLLNVSFFSTLLDPFNKRFTWSYGLPILECWGWSFTVKQEGGAIATIGNTGLGLEAGGEVGDLNGDGINEPDCVESFCGYLETQFFKSYQTHHIDILGETWCNSIVEYLSIYPGMEEWSDAKILEQWMLLGDPSLKIGGYASD
jgi:hypothetical protein